MLSKILSMAALATILSTTAGTAQSVARLGGPANLPPASFNGQQFVDNRGCLFLRAGFGATINWVPRVDRSHRPLCGYPPSFGAAVAAAVAADMAPGLQVQAVVPAPVTAPAPAARPRVVVPQIVTAPAVQAPAVRTPAVQAPAVQAPAVQAPGAPRQSLMTLLFGSGPAPLNATPITRAPVTVVPVVMPTPGAPMATAQPTYTTAATGAGVQIQCFRQAPKLERVWLRSGGTALVCTRGDGTLTGWLPPLFPQGAGVDAGLDIRPVTRPMMAGASLQPPAVRAAAANAIPTPPKGYKLAWSDDRLNPLRGVGTAQGQAQQDQVWTRNVPAVLVAVQPQARVTVRAVTTGVSTMSAPQAPLATGSAYVQVGTFGQPVNADSAKARLAALGLPVSTSKIIRKGKELQIVFAGPFASSAQAQSALAAARSAGFGDAILR